MVEIVKLHILEGTISIYKDWLYAWPKKMPKKGFFIQTLVSSNEINRILNNLITVKETTWKTIVMKERKHVMTYDYSNTKLKKILKISFMKKIRVSIIGAGNMANEYLKVLSSNKNIELSGIFSRTFAKAELLKKKYKIKKNLVSLKKLYKETKSQIVIATVPGDKILSLCKVY